MYRFLRLLTIRHPDILTGKPILKIKDSMLISGNTKQKYKIRQIQRGCRCAFILSLFHS